MCKRCDFTADTVIATSKITASSAFDGKFYFLWQFSTDQKGFVKGWYYETLTLPSYLPLQYGRGKSHAAVPAEVARQERVVWPSST